MQNCGRIVEVNNCPKFRGTGVLYCYEPIPQLVYQIRNTLIPADLKQFLSKVLDAVLYRYGTVTELKVRNLMQYLHNEKSQSFSIFVRSEIKEK